MELLQFPQLSIASTSAVIAAGLNGRKRNKESDWR